MIEVSCPYGVDHDSHEYPDDWTFAGADGCDPRADVRWQPSTYTYYDADTTELHVTQTPLCDDQALDEFTLVCDWYRHKASPVWISVKRPGEKMVMLPYNYDPRTDTVREVVRA